ncbi:MAG: hypothetical protein LBP33_13085 [Candidatus Adiutrix sp.]|jgi:hypothetical protein|nr:hypothetical protein [Candidatus Adiutrix sp.]
MGIDLYPLTLEPLMTEHSWGRGGEAPESDENLPPGFSTGTLWMAGDHSRVSAGPLAGKSLSYVRQIWGPGLVGANAGGDPDSLLPVELKLKRTGDSALALALDDDSLWYVLAAEEDSSLNAGYRPGLDFEAAARAAGGDPGRWSEFMPEYSAEPGQALFLPLGAAMILGAGLTMAQIGPPSQNLKPWPLGGRGPEALRLARQVEAPVWLDRGASGPGLSEIYNDERLTVTLVNTTHLSTVASPDAATFIWPLFGQGRIRARGPAPVTRLVPGRAVMVPAGLGRYAVESGGSVGYLLIEAY